MVYTKLAPTAAVSRGTSHVTVTTALQPIGTRYNTVTHSSLEIRIQERGSDYGFARTQSRNDAIVAIVKSMLRAHLETRRSTGVHIKVTK